MKNTPFSSTEMEKQNIQTNLPTKSKPSLLDKIPFLKNIINTLKNKNTDSYTEKNTHLPTDKKNSYSNSQNKRNQLLKNLQSKPIIKQPETLVVSDLHGDINRWNSLKTQLRIHPNLKIIIAGDAMDRDRNGVDILLQIKELSDTGRVTYIPGNHDLFAYNYLKAKNVNPSLYKESYDMLVKNGGTPTLYDLDHFDELVDMALKNGSIKQKITKEELTSWLGNLPVQMLKEENNTKYAIAHALFDTKLYQADKNFCLAKAFKLMNHTQNLQEQEMLNRFMNCMQYREGNALTQSAPIAFPKGYLMIVGHTRGKDTIFSHLENRVDQPILYIDCANGNFRGFNLSTHSDVNLENPHLKNKSSINKNERDD